MLPLPATRQARGVGKDERPAAPAKLAALYRVAYNSPRLARLRLSPETSPTISARGDGIVRPGKLILHPPERRVVMQTTGIEGIIKSAIATVREASAQQTGGKWLENITVLTAPLISEWDVGHCYPWGEWPEREIHFPETTNQDVGIDAVAVRRSDGQHIAIQCKARQLDEQGHGGSISKDELDKFISSSADAFWAERWLVTNGDNPVSPNVARTPGLKDKPIKVMNIANDLLQQQATPISEECPHCEPNPDGEERRQTKTCMQNEAVTESVRILREHEQSDSGGLPIGQARGRIILPCGTGKTRISLRIVEELTPPGGISIVLCPSIALVAQIRREYLQNAESGIRALAVCSDETAGYDPKKEDSRNTAADPTLDNSNVSASEVKGKVTTDSAEIAQWIREGRNAGQISVIFGTYQSGRRVAEAVRETGEIASVLVADEAHRTAGLRRKRNAKNGTLSPEDRRIRDFTLCHDNDAFPATYRIYQTATPRIYDTSRVSQDQARDWIVRTMDDETVFGVELYRKSYVEAVNNGWLSDYRIIALGVNDPEAFRQANLLAANTQSKGKRALTSTDYLRGLAFALAMGGATQDRENGNVPIKSCIAFMNTVDKSKNMAQDLQTDAVRKWLQDWLSENREGQTAAQYALEHLDATSNVTARENAKLRLAESEETTPHGIINVGIFGEGTDSPSLNAVAFLEARKSPIDVIQAVGRAMRTSLGKEMGYIICPILIPPNTDPEKWLSASAPEDGWQELGQILLALRAHDQRIEDNLAELLQLYVPTPPETESTIVAVADDEKKRITYAVHVGPPGEASRAVNRVLNGESRPSQEFIPLTETAWQRPAPTAQQQGVGLFYPMKDTEPELKPIKEPTGQPETTPIYEQTSTELGTVPRTHTEPISEPTVIVSGKRNSDGATEIRRDAAQRGKPAADGTPGSIDVKKSKAKAKKMINEGEGIRVNPNAQRTRRSAEEVRENNAMQMLLLTGLADHGNAIRMNLLAKSGLTDNRVVRDLNILESSVKEAAHHLRSDNLQPALDRHFGLDNLDQDKRKGQADGCTIAALLMMNAAMLHQRISNGRWLSGVSDLEIVKNDVNVVRRISREWNQIMRHDFRPVLEPAVKAVEAMEDTGKLSGLERALRHITAEAERIAETYADMGADHAGPLFNRVMGNQASDGAYFTRPVAASIAARLTLDDCGEVDWRDPAVWEAHKIVDLACGSGTLLAAMLTDMKRRAREQGASEAEIGSLQKLAVEETIKGLEINPVSLQLAASQLTAGNQEISYRRMGLHLMPYGPQPDNPAQVSAGTLELLGQRAIVARDGELELADDRIASQNVWNQRDDAELEDAVEAVMDARIVIMNPPFTARTRMGEKFPDSTKKALRNRADLMEQKLIQADPDLEGFVDKKSTRPLFAGLADHCLNQSDGILTTINPTIALTAVGGQAERVAFAKRYHVHTVLTCHQPGNINMSQNTAINESILVMQRYNGPKPPTRFINLDRVPVHDHEVGDFHQALLNCSEGLIANGWGEVSLWPTELIEAGDWTPAIWRSPSLAKATSQYADHPNLTAIKEIPGCLARASGPRLHENFEKSTQDNPGSISVLESKGADAQKTIKGTPDSYWIAKPRREAQAEHYSKWSSHLLVTAGQDNSTARLTASASGIKYMGGGWTPVTGLSADEAKAISVFINSTAGRLQLMRSPARKIEFPNYTPQTINDLKVPDVKDARIRQILADCWERTKDTEVPQFRDGECEVRRLWDEAVAEAMGWDASELERLRHLLHQEPHVRGLGYGQYADEAVAEEPDYEEPDYEDENE